MDLQTLIERMTPFDCDAKKNFIELLEEFPELKEDLVSMLQSNTKWVEKVKSTNNVKFIINDSRWKTSEVHRISPYVILNTIKSIPVVSINL